MISRPNGRTPIDFSGEFEGDFTGVQSVLDLRVGEELPRGVSCSEGYLNLFPDGVEAICRNSIDHRDERLAAGQTRVGLVNEIQRGVVLKERLFSCRLEFNELDRKEVSIIVGRHFAGR